MSSAQKNTKKASINREILYCESCDSHTKQKPLKKGTVGYEMFGPEDFCEYCGQKSLIRDTAEIR